jgi:hypothetical protein
VATLNELRKDDTVVKNLPAGTPPYDVTPDRIRNSALFVAEPLSVLAPRFKLIQGHLPPGSARITGDIVALRDRFQKTTGLEGVEVRYWSSPAPDAWSRVTMAFVPPNEGGSDRSPPGQRRQERFLFEQIPWAAVPPFLLQLSGEPGDRIRSSFANRALALRQPGRPRDLQLRGQFQEATEQLVEFQAQINKRTISERELEVDSRGWAEAASGVYADLIRAERATQTDALAAGSLAEIREKIDNLWRNSKGPSMYLDVVASPFLNEESTFLLALSKHEQAERLTHRKAVTNPADWDTTRKWWVQYLNTYPNSPAAGAARRNLAVALAGEGNAEAAKREFQTLADSQSLPGLERLACRILAAQLK